MPLGFVSAILPDLSLEEVLTFASEQGFETVEVMCCPVGKAERRYAGVTHIGVGSMRDAEVERIKELTAETTGIPHAEAPGSGRDRLGAVRKRPERRGLRRPAGR